MCNKNEAKSSTFRDFSDYTRLGISKSLKTNFIGREVCFYETTDSTNKQAKINSHMPHGTLFVANNQTSGRGRMNRTWVSGDDGVWLSILLEPDITPDKVSLITLVMGLAVCDVIKDSKIKWPNDIVLNNKKICGILTEMMFKDNKVECVVAGIGVNLNTEKFPEEIKEVATSLYLETKTKSSKTEFLADLCYSIEKYYSLFEMHGFKACVDEYKSRCVTLGRKVLISNSSDSFEAEAFDITNDGELLVKTDNGIEKVISGEVSVRGLFGYI